MLAAAAGEEGALEESVEGVVVQAVQALHEGLEVPRFVVRHSPGAHHGHDAPRASQTTLGTAALASYPIALRAKFKLVCPVHFNLRSRVHPNYVIQEDNTG